MDTTSFNLQDDRTTGYHLFLEPAGVTAAILEGMIQTLAEKYDGPSFKPHVTLLANFQCESEELLLERAAHLAESMSSHLLTLGELGSDGSYYRALYSRIVEHEQVAAWHELACAAFDIPRSEMFAAHLSLLYGHLPAELIDEAKEGVHIPHGTAFVADILHVYRTEGVVGEWYKVGEYPFR